MRRKNALFIGLFLLIAKPVFAIHGITLYDSNTTNYSQILATATLNSSYSLIMPNGLGSAGQVLSIGNVIGNSAKLVFVNQQGGGGGSSSGYAIQPATVTIQAGEGMVTTTETISGLSPGVMQVVAGSSNVTTSAVILASQSQGPYVSSVNVTSNLTVTPNGANNSTLTLDVNTANILSTTSAASTYITQSSVTSTYFQIASTMTLSPTFLLTSSASANFVTQSSVAATYFQISSTMSLSPIFLLTSSFTANGLTQSSATATYLNKLSNYVANANTNGSLTGGSTGSPAASLTLGINSSSGTLQGNTFNGPSQLIQANASTQYPALDGSLILRVSSLAVTGVTAGSYTNTNLTVNAQGQITAASNGSSGGGSGTTIWGQYNETPISNSVSTITTNGVIQSSVTASNKYAVFLNYNTTQFSNTASTFTANSSTFTLQGNAFNGANQLVQLNGSTQLPAVSGALLTNLPVQTDIYPATTTALLNFGAKISTLTITSLGAGVLHTVNGSSNVVSGLVILSTETSGPFISSANVSAGITITANGTNNSVVTIGADTTYLMTQSSASTNELSQSSAAVTYQYRGNYITSVSGLGTPIAIGTGTGSNFTNIVSSPAYALSFEGMQHHVLQIGNTTYVVIDTMSPTGLMVISSMTNYMTQSSATLNELSLSSASITYQPKGNYLTSLSGAILNQNSLQSATFNVSSGSVANLTIVSSNTQNGLQIIENGNPSGGVQNLNGGALNITNTNQVTDMLVLYSSVTDPQNGASMMEFWQQAPLWNDPDLWFHDVSTNSGPQIRIDAGAPNVEVVNLSTDNTHGLGKFEPFAIGYQSVNLQVNSRSYDNTTFENLALWHPLQNGGGLELIPSTNSNGDTYGIDTADLTFDTTNGHIISITGPISTTASFSFALPNTPNNQGQILYQSDNGRGGPNNTRSWAFTTGGATGNILQYNNGSAPTWIPSSSLGWNIYNATATAGFPFGASFSSMNITGLSPGVLHSLATSSNVVSGLVILSTETSGPFISSANVSAGITITANGTNNSVVTIGADTTYLMTQSSASTNELSQSSAAATYQYKGNYITSIAGLGMPVSIGTGTSSNYTNIVSTPMSGIDFEGMQFKVTALGTTGYVLIDTMSATGVIAQSTGTNAAGQLVRLNSSTQYPALDASLELRVSSLAATGVGSGSCTNCNLTYNPQGQLTVAANGSAGGSSSSLAVGTGTVSNFTTKVTSPTAAESFLGGQFNSTAAGTTNFISLNPSSVTLQGNLFNGPGQLIEANASTQYPALDASLILRVSSLTASGAIAGTYGSASSVSTFTVSAQGIITQAGNIAISISSSNITGGVILNNNSLQSGSTSYPQYSYIGSSQTVPNLTVTSTATLTSLVVNSTATFSGPTTYSSSDTFNGIALVNQGLYQSASNKTSSYVMTSTDSVIFASGTANTSINITLPSAANTGQTVRIIKVDKSTNTVNIYTQSSQLISMSTASFTLWSPGQMLELIADGGEWQPYGSVLSNPPYLGFPFDPNGAQVLGSSTIYCALINVPNFCTAKAFKFNYGVATTVQLTQFGFYDTFGNAIATTTATAFTSAGVSIATITTPSFSYLYPGNVWQCVVTQSPTAALTRPAVNGSANLLMDSCVFAQASSNWPLPKTLTFNGCTPATTVFAIYELTVGGVP